MGSNATVVRGWKVDLVDHLNGKLQGDQQRNIKKAGRTQKGVQRYRCKTCHRTFPETKGTIFYRKRTPAKEILETLALLAEGSRISRRLWQGTAPPNTPPADKVTRVPAPQAVGCKRLL